MKKSNKADKTTREYDSQRETRVLLEEIRSEVKTVAEQHGSMVKSLDNIESDLTSAKSELTTVKLAVMDNSREIKELKTGQKELKEKVDRIENKLDIVTINHEQRLQKIEATK